MAEELSFQEVEELLESILNDKKLIKLDILSSRVEFVIFSYPTADEILHSRYRREQALLEAQEQGLPSIEAMDQILADREITSSEDQQTIKELEEKISGQRRLLQLTKIAGRRAPIEEAISKYLTEIEELNAKRESFYYLTQEKKADEEAMLYLAWAVSRSIDGSKYWNNFEAFENERDLDFRNTLLIEFSQFNRGLASSKIRYIARHSLWRIRYTAALKIGGSLFNRDLDDLTPDQLNLLYWSNYYQSIYEMLPDEQPDEDTIKDDEALDVFMEAYFKRRESDTNEGKVKRRGAASKKAKLSAWEKGEELIITPAHPEYMSLAYSEQRVKSPDGASDVEVVSPNSKRAKNKRARAKARIRGGAKGTR